MSDSKTLRPVIEHTPFQTQPTQNVHGWVRTKIERAGEELKNLKTRAEVAAEKAVKTAG